MKARLIDTDYMRKTATFRILDNIGSLSDKTDMELDLKVEKYHAKRSKDANRYMWHLCGELAAKCGTTSEAIYRSAIKAVGVVLDYQSFTKTQYRVFKKVWEDRGIGWFTEIVDTMPDGETLHIRGYFGSSTYDTKQMGRLIDYLVEDCKQCGIEVRTDIGEMMARWESEINSAR